MPEHVLHVLATGWLAVVNSDREIVADVTPSCPYREELAAFIAEILNTQDPTRLIRELRNVNRPEAPQDRGTNWLSKNPEATAMVRQSAENAPPATPPDLDADATPEDDEPYDTSAM